MEEIEIKINDLEQFGKKKQVEYNITGNIPYVGIYFLFIGVNTLFNNEVILEKAKLLLLLKVAYQKKSSIKISITKGIANSVELINLDTIEELIFYLDKDIYSERGKLYEDIFGWESKIKIDNFEYGSKTDKLIELFELAQQTDDNQEIIDTDSLKQIINMEANAIKQDKYNDKTHLKFKIQYVVKTLKDKKIFKSNLKTIASNEACLIYDLFAFANLVPADISINNQEKYQFIKRHIKE